MCGDWLGRARSVDTVSTLCGGRRVNMLMSRLLIPVLVIAIFPNASCTCRGPSIPGNERHPDIGEEAILECPQSSFPPHTSVRQRSSAHTGRDQGKGRDEPASEDASVERPLRARNLPKAAQLRGQVHEYPSGRPHVL